LGLRLEEAPAALEQGPASDVAPELKRFRLRPARFPGLGSEGPACLTFHTHDEGFTTQQNRALVGRVSEAEDGKILFRVERLLGDWSLAGSNLKKTFELLFRKRRRLKPRLKRRPRDAARPSRRSASPARSPPLQRFALLSTRYSRRRVIPLTGKTRAKVGATRIGSETLALYEPRRRLSCQELRGRFGRQRLREVKPLG
jgi:hypothetical protein